MEITVETFEREIARALKNYERYIVCLEKAPEEFKASVCSLVEKAIDAYVNREPNLRHGIALDKHVTVMVSQTEGARPLCGIYFNLHTPYKKS